MVPDSPTDDEDLTSGSDRRPTVLVVEDEHALADLYAAWLDDEYDVRVAHDRAEALEAADDDVDVALLDRRLPDGSGDDVLSALRERGYDCGVAMVTAVDPDFDIVEMPFDEYATKPLSGDDLRDVVERLLRRRRYDEHLSELYRVAATMGALEAAKAESELEASEEYRELQARYESIEADLDADAPDLDDADYRRLLGEPNG